MYWPEVEKEEWRTEAPASKTHVNISVKSTKWLLIQPWRIFAKKSERSSPTLPPVSSVSHRCERLQPAPRKNPQLRTQKQDNVIVVMILTHPSWCSAAHRHRRTHAHTPKTVLRLVSWLHPVKNNDKYVKNCEEGTRLEARTWSETWPEVLMC